MKAIIEATPKLEDLNEPHQAILMKQFFTIVHHITICNSRDELMEKLDYLKTDISFQNEPHYFHWGFGECHVWVKQRGNNNRLIFADCFNICRLLKINSH